MAEPVTRPTLEGTAEHTPGPWRVMAPSGGDPEWGVVAESDGYPVAVLNIVRQPARANANLIAQAPALAAENQKLREALRQTVAALSAISGMAYMGHVNCSGYDYSQSSTCSCGAAQAVAGMRAALASAAPLLGVTT